MKVVTIPKIMLNPITLPGMGRSVEINQLSPADANEVRTAYMQQQLYLEFEEEPGDGHLVINLWPDPHDMTRLTLFIK